MYHLCSILFFLFIFLSLLPIRIFCWSTFEFTNPVFCYIQSSFENKFLILAIVFLAVECPPDYLHGFQLFPLTHLSYYFRSIEAADDIFCQWELPFPSVRLMRQREDWCSLIRDWVRLGLDSILVRCIPPLVCPKRPAFWRSELNSHPKS